MLEANLVFTRVLSLHGGTPTFEHDFCHSHHLVPLFLVLVMVFCKMDCVFFNQNWCQTNILWIFHGMVTSLGHRMALTRPHKRCQQPQNFTRHNKSQSGGWGGKIKFSFVFNILCNDTNTKPMFCKHINLPWHFQMFL